MVGRFQDHSSETCWQFDIRKQNLREDLEAAGMTSEFAASLRCKDFVFGVAASKEERAEIKAFIERHEWLGNLSQYTTHWFTMRLGDKLAGAVLMGMPNAFSKLLGEGTSDVERLISRGACISWSPKNLGSKLITDSIKWMASNTQYRLFTAYSDPQAKELGTIYQACNFYYLGKNAGTTTRYINPYTGKIVSDRFFRQRTAYRKYAKELGLEWDASWTTRTGMNWGYIPLDIEQKLRQASRDKQASSTALQYPPKHKYAYVLGASDRETDGLRKQFLERNKIYPYPKRRGE